MHQLQILPYSSIECHCECEHPDSSHQYTHLFKSLPSLKPWTRLCPMLWHWVGLGFKLVTFWPTVACAGVATLSLITHCKALKHNESACTQALSNDMPTMHRQNLHPLLTYEIHLLYFIMLVETHRRQDISSSSLLGQLTPLDHSSTRDDIRS